MVIKLRLNVLNPNLTVRVYPFNFFQYKEEACSDPINLSSSL